VLSFVEDKFAPDKEETYMRRHPFRALILAAALATLAVPVFNLAPMASACSTATCSSSGGSTGLVDSYFSQLTVGTPTTVCGEVMLTGEHNYAFTCDLTFGISDLRGNNEGFVASVSSGGFTNSLAWDSVTGMPVTIPPGDITNSGVISTTPISCVGTLPGVSCETEYPLLGTVGAPLSASSPLPIIVGCPTQEEGEGTYSNAVALDVLVPAGTPEGEVFAKHALSWTGTFTVTVTESPSIYPNPGAINFVGLGCPAGSSA
jgi:hypothetical protein